LLEAYQGFQDPVSLRAIERIRTPVSNSPGVPTVFPESYPFSLIAHLPQAYTNVNLSVTSIDRPIFNPGLGETAATLVALILVASNKHLLDLLEDSFEIEGREKLTNLLHSLFKVAASILDNDAFPNTWLNISILSHKVLLKMMDPICSILERDFIPDRISSGEFNTRLWMDCFVMLLKLLSSDQLVIEDFSPQVRNVPLCSFSSRLLTFGL
jgi:dedicator of cytokinesis protein 3